MILTRDAILAEIAAGRVVIDPFAPDQVGPASVDLHLADEIRVIDGGPPVIDVNDDADYRTVSRVQPLRDPYVLSPGETIHGITREQVTLPDDIAGWLEGRSRFARLGLMIHVTAGFVNPGIRNRQVLEISNVSNRPLAIHAGTRICQIVLQRCEGRARYEGRFAEQEKL
ncbi:MAG TPA: dCTP deaminase [Candidatus Binatia bacterium]|nr:dCTP deaminase [Candidatus Binatia bacterium]